GDCTAGHGVAGTDARPGARASAIAGPYRRVHPGTGRKLGSAPPRRPSSPGVSDVAGPIAADLRAGRGSQLAGRSRGRRPAPRFRRLPVPLRAPDHPPAGALSPDAALDALVL